MKLRKIICTLLALSLFMTSVPVASGMTVAAQTNDAYKGVDVSRWNGEIDWSVMKKKGIDFAILRCYSYGKDKKFDEYYEGATEAGIDVGAYIYMYATTSSGAVSEAYNTLSALDGRALDYPLFLDIEDDDVKKLSKSTLTDLAIRELEIFRKAGYEVGIYCSKSFQSDYLDMSRLGNYYLWTAKWSLYSTEKDGKKYYFKDMSPYDESRPTGDLWQFTNGGYGPNYGVEAHYLDLDYCYIDFKNKYESTVSKNPDDYAVPERTLRYVSSSLMRGKDVAWVQAVLYQLGYTACVDGAYGPTTKTAVTEFQKKCGLAESGCADTETVNKLRDVYLHRSFSATVKYNPNNSSSTVSAGKVGYGTAFVLGENMNFKNGTYYLCGYTVKRSSDNKYYCTNGKWHTAGKISEGKYFKRIFSDRQKISFDEGFLYSPETTSDTYTFTAVWETQKNPKYTVYSNGSKFSVYYSSMTFEEAEKFCAQRGSALASFEDAGDIATFGALKNGDKFLVGAKSTGNGYVWNTGKNVGFTVDGDGSYLTLSSDSLNEPNVLFAVNDASDVSGFIMESVCGHENIIIEGFADTLCTVNGYSGDKVCADCKAVLEKGSEVKAKGHAYTAYTVTKAPTCKDTGEKERYCNICGSKQTKTVAKTENHVFKTTVVKKATTKESGKATDKCKVCGLVKKEYTVKRIKSVTPEYTSAAYTGKKLYPSVTVKDKDGNILEKGKDYSVSYEKNKYVGKAYITVTFKGKYEGSVRKSFKIVPQSTSFTSASTKNKSVTLKWKKISKQSTGYYIEYSPSKTFSKNVYSARVRSPKTLTKTVKNLKRGKTYYFRVRTYKTTGGTNYYSKWSKVRSIKVK